MSSTDIKTARRVRTITRGLIACVASATMLFIGCAEDDGNYEYLSDEEAGIIEITVKNDSAGLRTMYTLTVGEHITFTPDVSYRYPERLRFRWYYYTLTNYRYNAVQVGNKYVYPPADTIGWAQTLDWTCDLDPGEYHFYIMVEDSVTGMRAYWSNAEQYTIVEGGSSAPAGVYLLTEVDGNTNIEVYASPLMLIAGDSCYYDYYHSLTGKYLEGKPRFITSTNTGNITRDGYMIATDENLYRLDASSLTTMNDWSTMFYNTPETFDPQTHIYINNCDFLINNGKMHVMYANQTNDRKFSDPVAGDYDAYPFLMKATYTTWRAVTDAINAWQVIYDEEHHCFRPYYARASSVSHFKSTVSDAYVDANNTPTDIKAIFQGGGYYTCLIADVNDTPYLYRYNFYNRVDSGELSAAGARSIIDLSGCTNIKNATKFASNVTGYAFYYTDGNAVYSFSASSGQTTSNTIYTCQTGEEVTAMYAWGSIGGGWPTSDCALWVATWNEQTQTSKLVQYEVDVNYGLPNTFWGPMFGAGSENPVITTGWQKIVDMINISAD